MKGLILRVVLRQTQSNPVTRLKSMCLTLSKAKTQNVRVWSEERFIDLEDAHREDATPN